MFLAMPLALLPFLADELDAEWALGLMYATVPLGALLVSVTSGWTARIHRHGRMVVLSAALWGVAIAAAGIVGNLWLVLLFLTVAGGCDMVSGIFRGVMWNQTIPDELRGGSPGSSCCRTPSVRRWARSGRAVSPRGGVCGLRCGRAVCCAPARWACWRCVCRS